MPPRPLSLPPSIQHEVQGALDLARRDPARRSEILGSTAIGLAARSQDPAHRESARVLRAIAERLAQASLAAAMPGPATRDDFEEALEDFDQAHGEQADDLSTLALANDLQDARTAALSPRVSIAPRTWGAGATLGRTGKFRFNPTEDDIRQGIHQSGTLAFWQGETHEAQAVTVDVGIPVGLEPPPVLQLFFGIATPDVSSRSRGIISYGTDGAVTRVSFDASFGTRFTVTGNYVTVQIAMDPPKPLALSGLMAFTASLGAFASPSVAPVYYTHYVDQLPLGLSTDGNLSLAGIRNPPPIRRPSHAAFLLAVLSDSVSGTARLEFYGQGCAQILTTFIYPIGQVLAPIPLPAEVQYIVLTNTTGQDANFRLVFQLAL